MTNAQVEEMKDWFLKDIWRGIMEHLTSWRFCGPFGYQNATTSSPAAAAKLMDEEHFGDVVSAKKPWGDECDSWWNKGFALYFATQWVSVLLGPGPDDPPDLSVIIGSSDEATSEVPCEL